MVRAIWNGAVLAESEHTVKVEGNHYFPPESLNREHFTASPTRSTCPWKGRASYYTITVDGKANPDAAWYYPKPSVAARNITGHVAFWHGVRIERTPGPGAEPPAGTSHGLLGRILGRVRPAGTRP